MKRLDGLDLTSKQRAVLMGCFGGISQTMVISKRQLTEAKLSDGEIDDLVAKGYLEELSSGDYLMPAGGFDVNTFVQSVNGVSIKDRIRQMEQGMFGLVISKK